MNEHSPVFHRDAEADGIVTRLAPPLSGTTWNAETRTVSAVVSAGAGVQRYDARGPYVEFLDPAGLVSGESVPLLDTHARGSVTAQLGTADQITVSGGEVRARLTLSRHNPAAALVAAELGDGRRYATSIGYRVLEWREAADPKTGTRSKTATKWTLLEVSLVPVPADPGAGTRSNEPMPQHTPPAPAPATPPAPPAPAPAPAPAPSTRAATNAEIRSIAQTLGLDQAWTDGQIDAEATPDQARAAALEAVRTRAQTGDRVRAIQIGEDFTDPAHRVRAAGEALYTRFTPSHRPSEQARRFIGMQVLDLARESLRLRGEPITGLSPSTVIERALHSTSDFPLILGDGIGRTLREAYRAAPSGLKQLGRRVTNADFRMRHRLQLSEAPRLEKVNESGEFKSGKLAEAKESFKVDTFGKIIGITRQSLVNDDLSAFADLARRFGQAAAATEAQILADLVLANAGAGPTMSDGMPLFHAERGNLPSPGFQLRRNGLDRARTTMRRKVGLTGELIDVPPRFLLVPPELETTAERVLAALAATKEEDVNPFSGSLALVVESRLVDPLAWYVVADPAIVDGLEYAYLEGEEGVVITTKAGFEVDGVQIKARLDFGAGFVEWRSWFKDPGSNNEDL